MRTHQEDFCQVLALYPSRKYERNDEEGRGPSAATMIRTAMEVGYAWTATAMADAIAFNVIVGNTDAHAKNLSLVYEPGGIAPRLAPLYDVMCAGLWAHVTPNLAMAIGGQTRTRHVGREHWRRLADKVGLNPTLMIGRVRGMAEAVGSLVDDARERVEAMPAGPDPCLAELAAIIRDNARAVLTNLG